MKKIGFILFLFIGYAIVAMLNGKLQKGIDTILNLINFDKEITDETYLEESSDSIVKVIDSSEDETVISKDVVIEDNVWLGNRVIVLPGVTIGEGAIIQAGSVVVNDIPKYAIAGGHPAKVFSSRDKDHYEMLKKEGKFH